MDAWDQVFIVALVSGLFLIGAELFVPGGILGTIAGIALITAAVSAFKAFGQTAGIIWSIAIIILSLAAIMVWIKVFPNTKLGKKLSTKGELDSAYATEEGLDELLGEEGEAASDLRPAGFVRIDGRRVDVVTQGGMIEKGSKVRIVEIEGNRVVVKKI